MLWFAIILIASSHFTVSEFSDEYRTEADKKCAYYEDREHLYCFNYPSSYLPFEDKYENVSSISIWGDYNRIVISAEYFYLDNLSVMYVDPPEEITFHDFECFTLRKLEVFTYLTATVNFTGIENLESLTSLTMKFDMKSHSCQGLKSLKNLTTVSLKNIITFDMNCLPTSLVELEFWIYNPEDAGSLASLQNLINLRNVKIGFKENFSFDFGILPSGVRTIELAADVYVARESVLDGCAPLRNLTEVSVLTSTCYPLDLTCLPPNLRALKMTCKSVSSIADDTCAALKDQHQLQKIELQRNHLKTFNISCLPEDVRYLDISENEITDLDFQLFQNLPKLELLANENPFNCNCSFLGSYVDGVKSKAIKKRFWCTSAWHKTYQCPQPCSEESQLFHYPWKFQIQDLIAFDKFSESEQCLIQV